MRWTVKGGTIGVATREPDGGLVGHCQGFGFNSEISREPQEVFEQGNMIGCIF